MILIEIQLVIYYIVVVILDGINIQKMGGVDLGAFVWEGGVCRLEKEIKDEFGLSRRANSD